MFSCKYLALPAMLSVGCHPSSSRSLNQPTPISACSKATIRNPHTSAAERVEAVTSVRRLLSIEERPPIQEAIDVSKGEALDD